MPSMRFMSTPLDPRVLPKIFSFDSSPGRAISRALGGVPSFDERSYVAELKEEIVDEKIYEIKMRREETDKYPGPHPLEKVGILHYSKPPTAP
jgi:hypothetical protein